MRRLQAGGVPNAQRAVYHRIINRLVRLCDMLIDGDIDVYSVQVLLAVC